MANYNYSKRLNMRIIFRAKFTQENVLSYRFVMYVGLHDVQIIVICRTTSTRLV